MEHENELKEALDFISPASLTYEEWTMVGMALKDSGLPVTVWEAWSARDGGRYHKGECAKKWESFHGSTKPVTESSIFQLAYSHGWSGPAGHALDWGDELSAGPGAQTEGRVVDPRWVEAHELDLPQSGTRQSRSSGICRHFLSRRNTLPTSPRATGKRTGALPPTAAPVS